MRAGSRPQYRRLRRIVDMVTVGMRSGRLPTMADFQRELEASRRTIARDLDFLRMEENAPIAFDARARGYRLADETFALSRFASATPTGETFVLRKASIGARHPRMPSGSGLASDR